LVGNLNESVVPPVNAFANSLFLAASAPFEATGASSVSQNVVIVDQRADDEDELVAVVPREVANAVSPELTGNQARDAAFESVNLIDDGLF